MSLIVRNYGFSTSAGRSSIQPYFWKFLKICSTEDLLISKYLEIVLYDKPANDFWTICHWIWVFSISCIITLKF